MSWFIFIFVLGVFRIWTFLSCLSVRQVEIFIPFFYKWPNGKILKLQRSFYRLQDTKNETKFELVRLNNFYSNAVFHKLLPYSGKYIFLQVAYKKIHETEFLWEAGANYIIIYDPSILLAILQISQSIFYSNLYTNIFHLIAPYKNSEYVTGKKVKYCVGYVKLLN